MDRINTQEWLDTDSGTPAEVAASLRDLGRLNRWFGGVATTRAMLELVARRRGLTSLSLLEVAAGAGQVPLRVREQLGARGIRITVTLSDRATSHLRRSGPQNGTHVVAADALALPFSGSSFDVVSSSLFAHHLPPERLVQFASEALRVCRIAVLINDLVRHPVHLALVYAGLPLYRSRLTRHDAPASVRQAYTATEMRELLEQAGAPRVEILRRYLFRMGVVIWKA
ncbi:MAG TPA: methyltransferase domain-containing protein [Terriglobales bacterium]